MTDTEISIEICRQLGIDLTGKNSGPITIKCINPHHNDKRPSCSVSLEKGVGFCFSCGHSFSLKNLYYEKFGVSIYKNLGINRTYSLYSFQVPEETADLSLLPETDFKFTGQCYPMDSTELSKRWVERRGFSIDLMNKLGIKYLKFGRTVKKSDPTNKEDWRSFSDMAYIPIFENGKMICFEARNLRTEEEWKKHLESKNIDIENKEYKKLLYPKNSSTKTLYKLDHLDTNEPLFLVEGLMDVLTLRTHPDFQNSTTTFGRHIKERQFYLLSKFKEIIYIPNLDAPGILAIEQFRKKNMKNVFILMPPNTVKDLNDVIQKKDPRFNSIQDLIDYYWLDRKIPLSDVNIESLLSAYS